MLKYPKRNYMNILGKYTYEIQCGTSGRHWGTLLFGVSFLSRRFVIQYYGIIAIVFFTSNLLLLSIDSVSSVAMTTVSLQTGQFIFNPIYFANEFGDPQLFGI